ncbi:MAG: ribosome silencing factor [Elusimicrobia bacterium]|nr:ribosome silencing factor [Elusimicrobiota bacterium]
MARTFKSLAVALARAAADKKAQDVLVLDVRRQSPIADYLLIATVTSPPHLEAVEEAVRKAGKDLNRPALRRARPESPKWRILDFGGILAHFMTEEARSFYALEKLYRPARPLDWVPRSESRPGKAKPG